MNNISKLSTGRPVSSIHTYTEKWDLRFLGLANHISEWSVDPSTKTGAVIVDKTHRIVSLGFNGFPKHIKDDPAIYNDREQKYIRVCHAEQNALDFAYCSVEGLTLYSTLFPCNQCSKSIIQRGIKEVVYYNIIDQELLKRFEEKLHWKESRSMLDEAQINTWGYYR